MCHVESEQQQVSKIIGTVQTDTAMQQQAAQANQTTTYQLPAHLSWENEFKTKKHHRTITQIKQDGANCGCFAAGMAIASLIRAPWNKALARDEALAMYEADTMDYAVAIAKGIEDIAINDGLSTIGEMFDADALTDAINKALSRKEILGQSKANKYHAVTATFSSDSQLKEILQRASQKRVRVLLPYWAGDGCQPETCINPETRIIEKCKPEDMFCAHWCGIKLAESSQTEATVQLYEGNQSATSTYFDISSLANSNFCLSDQMYWKGYFDILTDNNEILSITKALRSRASKLKKPPFKQIFIDESEQQWNSSSSIPPIEIANLRNKVILIGKNADPPQGVSTATPPAVEDTPAAPAPAQQTASTGGTE